MEDSLIEAVVSNILDRIGLSADEVEWRIKMWKYIGFFLNLPCILKGINENLLITGSRTEGVGLNVLGSDTDVMICSRRLRVIHNVSQWKLKPESITVIADTNTIHPGYCLLRVMDQHKPTFSGVVVSEVDRDTAGIAFSMQGPAKTYRIGEGDMDKVECCDTLWPPSAREWLQRPRPSGFPPSHLIMSAEGNGAHVVSTGHKASSRQDLEWRFSFSQIELELIRMWPNTTLRCYVLLKLLKKEIVKHSPHLSHTLSSYYLKTLLFWLMEDTGVDYWIEHSLMKCLMFSLTNLLKWVESGCIPHYFIRNNNLFDTEIGTARHTDLSRVLRGMVTEGPQCILHCDIIRVFVLEKTFKEFTEGITSVMEERIQFAVLFSNGINFVLDNIMVDILSRDLFTLVGRIHKVMDQLATIAVDQDNEIGLSIRYIVHILKSIRGSCILSCLLHKHMSNSTRFLLFMISEQILRESTNQKTVQLRLAIFYCKTGQYRHATKILQLILENIDNTVKIGSTKSILSAENIQVLTSINSPFEVYLMSMTIGYIFIPTELHSVPHVLQYEMFKNSQPPKTILDIFIHYHKNDVLVDPHVLTYYLQNVCYLQLGKQKHAQVAFDNLRWSVKDKNVLHRDTALNVLGQCYLGRREFRRAIACFVTSVLVRPRCTTALLHLAIAIRHVV